MPLIIEENHTQITEIANEHDPESHPSEPPAEGENSTPRSDGTLSDVRPHFSDQTPTPEAPAEQSIPASAVEELFFSSTHTAAAPIAFLPEEQELGEESVLTREEIEAAAAQINRSQNLSCSSGECGDVSASLTETLDPIAAPSEEETEAATKIQAHFRGHRARQSLLRREDACTAGSSADAPAADLRHSGEFHDSLVLPPALATGLLLQAAGHSPSSERTEAADQQDDKQPLVDPEGMPTAFSDNEMDFLDKAATKIQATFRGFKTRSDLSKKQGKEEAEPAAPSKEDHAAASKIQAGFRGFKVRKEMKEAKSPPAAASPATDEEEQSAVKIQAGVRGFLTRQRLKKDKAAPQPPLEPQPSISDEINDAVVKIQAGFRGFKARQEVKNIRSANK